MANLFNLFEIFLIILEYQYIKCILLNEKFPSTLLLSNGDLFLVTEKGFRLYDPTLKTLKNHYNFTSDDKKISDVNDAQLTAIAQFSDGIIIALVKNYLYALQSNGNYILEQNLNGYLTNGKYYSLIAYKYESSNYDYIISYYDSNVSAHFSIKYFRFSTVTTVSIENPIINYAYTPINSQGLENILAEYGLSCQLMINTENKEVLTCFYQINSPDELSVTSFEILENSINPINMERKFSPNNRASIIKAVTSYDKKKALICYNKYYADGICLQYNIVTNEFSPEVKYFNQCKGMANFINVYYFHEREQYMFICNDNSKGFNVVLFDSEFQSTIPNKDIKESEPYYQFGGDCHNIFSFNIIYLASIQDYILINDCELNGYVFSTGNVNLERLSRANNFPIEEDYDIFSADTNGIINSGAQTESGNNDETGNREPTTQINESTNKAVIDKTEKTKEEIINNLDDLITNKDPKQSYVINGEDFTVIIKPVNEHVEESTVNIDFSECEKVLKEKYPQKEFRILQVNMENKKENILTDQVEYKIYDENGDEIELSICNNVNIIIEYEIKNTSLLNLAQISNFKDQGIDIFDLNHEFFNDICYSYSDNNSSSDMILSDRVSDIYQNYSVCGEGCEYESFNVDKLSANCNCKVKQEMSTESEEGNFKSYIVGAFVDSNFGVAKCYKLVFSIKGKLKNAGFWIFGIMVLSHIPIYIFYFINGTTTVVKYINNEMDKNGYKSNKIDFKNQLAPRMQSTTSDNLESNINSPHHVHLKKGKKTDKNNNNPPKKYKSSKNINKEVTRKHKKILFTENSPKLNKIERHISISDNEEEIYKKKLTKKQTNKDNHKSQKIDEILINKEKNKKNKKIKLINDNNSFDNACNLNLNNNLNTIETNINTPMRKNDEQKNNNNIDEGNDNIINEIIIDDNDIKHKNEKIKFNRNKKNNLITELESGEFLTRKKELKHKLHRKKSKRKSNKKVIPKIETNEENKIIKTNEELNTEFPLILINANNIENYKPIKSNHILNNYDYDEAVKYEQRSFCRIFFIYLISKENILNIIFFNPPLELKPMRMSIFIFNFACDFALNALFYLSGNISDKYHYNGPLKQLYTIINNLTKSLTSTIVSFILLYFFQSLTKSNNKIEKLFREQELLLKTNKKYKVDEERKELIKIKIDRIMKCLKFKIIFFIIFELIFILFFFYYVTAFCQVYQNTQVSWLLDCIISYVISLLITLALSFICSFLYRIAIKYRRKFLYKILIFIYSG